MAGINKKGSGSMRTRADGKKEYRLSYIDEYGDVKRKSFYGSTEDECHDQARLFLAEQEMRRRGIDCDKTIPEILKEHFEYDYETNYVSEGAYYRNLSALKRIENHPIGSMPIIRITEKQLEAFMKTMTCYSNSVIQKTHQQLKLAYTIAQDDGLVGSNLMKTRKLARRPKSDHEDKVVVGFTEEEQARFLAALDADKVPRNRNNYKNQLKIELFTGLRMGEINALKKEDVDFARGVIHVRRTISRGLNDRYYVRESTKTGAGRRDVPLNDLVKPVLEDAIKNAPANKQDLIFFDTNKKNVISTQQVNYYFRRLCKKANIEVRGQHSLRHSFATRCIEAGIPAIVLKTWMGHTDIHVTLDTYADVFNRMNTDAIKKFEEYSVNVNMQGGTA